MYPKYPVIQGEIHIPKLWARKSFPRDKPLSLPNMHLLFGSFLLKNTVKFYSAFLCGMDGASALTRRQKAPRSLVRGWRTNLPRRFVRRSLTRLVFRLGSHLASNQFSPLKLKNTVKFYSVFLCGMDGARTRDLLRDRQTL